MPVDRIESTSEPHSYIVRGTGKFTGLDSYFDAVKLSIFGFSVAGSECFKMLPNLNNVSFDDNLISMEDFIFRNTNVSYFIVPKSVTMLSAGQSFDEGVPFVRIYVHPDNKYYCDIDGIVYTKDKRKLYHWPGNHGEEYVVVPDFVEETSIAAFGRSTMIKYIRFPPNVKYIGSYQFARNEALEYVEIQNKPNDNRYNIEKMMLSSPKDRSIIHFKPVPFVTYNCNRWCWKIDLFLTQIFIYL